MAMAQTAAQTAAQAQAADLAELKALRAENARLKLLASKPGPALRCRVGQSGGLSVYGLGRWPVTLYQEQWTRLAEFMPSVMAFVDEHAAELKTKA